MIVRFSIRNYKSIKETQTINFKPDLLLKDSTKNINEDLLKYIILMGDNDSGKSNVLEPFRNLVKEITERKNSQDRYAWVEPNNQTRFNPTEFTIEFIVNGILYEYYISILDKVIRKEVLYASFTAKKTMLYERTYGGWVNNQSVYKLKTSVYLKNIDLKAITMFTNATDISSLSLPTTFYDMDVIDQVYKYFLNLNNTNFLMDNFCSSLSVNNLYEKLNNIKHQVILVAYNPAILNIENIRRDQVYIVRKENNETEVIPLFNARTDGGVVRKDTNLMKCYVDGDYNG
jgi:AAA15 family ATPase/GTPase